jgi:hypothetical protein
MKDVIEPVEALRQAEHVFTALICSDVGLPSAVVDQLLSERTKLRAALGNGTAPAVAARNTDTGDK